MVAVWSEVDPALTSYTDCTYCSVLMVIAASGFTAFPLGSHTHEERRAFRGGDARLNFAGPVDRAAARYGISVISPAPYSQGGLQTALASAGKAYAVAGRLVNFPAGHPIRRHDPSFAGFHAVCVIPLGNGQVRWLDPLAPMGYAGDVIAASDVTDVFALGNYPNDARFLPTSIGADMPSPLAIYQPADITLGGGPLVNGLVPIKGSPSNAAPNEYELTPGQGELRTIGQVPSPDGNFYVYWDVPKGKWLYVNASYVPIRRDLLYDRGDVDEAVAKAIAALSPTGDPAALTEARADVATLKQLIAQHVADSTKPITYRPARSAREDALLAASQNV